MDLWNSQPSVPSAMTLHWTTMRWVPLLYITSQVPVLRTGLFPLARVSLFRVGGLSCFSGPHSRNMITPVHLTSNPLHSAQIVSVSLPPGSLQVGVRGCRVRGWKARNALARLWVVDRTRVDFKAGSIARERLILQNLDVTHIEYHLCVWSRGMEHMGGCPCLPGTHSQARPAPRPSQGQADSHRRVCAGDWCSHITSPKDALCRQQHRRLQHRGPV